VVIAGPSGAGKSTVVAALRRRHPFHFSVSATTRPPRPSEVDGVHYRFVERAEFERMAQGGELLEWAEYGANLYGTPREAVEAHLRRGRDVLLEIEIQGARQVRRGFPAAVMVFIAPPSLEELERRLRRRGDTDEQAIARRLEIARREMAEAPGLFDHVVVNRDIEETVAEVGRLLHLRPPPGGANLKRPDPGIS
jgi:guanylate kinase